MSSPIYGRDITGQKFGQLTAVRPTGRTCKFGSRIWEFKCYCGKRKEMTTRRLREGETHCGCLKPKPLSLRQVEMSNLWLAKPLVGGPA